MFRFLEQKLDTLLDTVPTMHYTVMLILILIENQDEKPVWLSL